MKFNKRIAILTFLLTACSGITETHNPMLSKGNFRFKDNAENSSYCMLQYLDKSYPSLTTTVNQIENGWKIALHKDKQTIFILTMTNAFNQFTVGELFLEENGFSNQSWVERVVNAALSCKGRLTY